MQKTLIMMLLAVALGMTSLYGQTKKNAGSAAQQPAQNETANSLENCDCNHYPWPSRCEVVCGRMTARVKSVNDSTITLQTTKAEYDIKVPQQVKANSPQVANGDRVTVLYKKEDGKRVATKLESQSAMEKNK